MSNVAVQVPYHDIPKLCCISRAFRERAAAELYRVLEHTFGPSQSRAQGLQKDVLAGSLETLATSEYNYASHIKEVLFDTTNAGESGERACREFSYEHSCGKFLQTLLLAVLKRTDGIERFSWNARVELSSAVYKTLHSMPHLRHLHIRLQIGPSLHSTSNTTTVAATASPQAATIVPTPHPGYGAPPGYIPGQSSSYSHQPQQVVVSSVHLIKKAPVARQILRPVTFSRFEKLASLSVLDMDTLETVPEIAECINKSSGTLKILCLSLSDKFARKARKASTSGSVSENTMTEDDASEVNAAPAPPLNIDGTENTSGMQLPDTPRSYLQAQDNALGQILASSQSSPPSRDIKVAAKDFVARAEQEEGDRELGLQLEMAMTEDKDDGGFEKKLEDLFGRRPTSKSDEETSNDQWYGELDKLASKYLESRKTTWKLNKTKKPAKVEIRRRKGKGATLPQIQPPSGVVAPGPFKSPPNTLHHATQPTVHSFVPLPHPNAHQSVQPLPSDLSSNTSSHSSVSSGWGAPAPASEYTWLPKPGTQANNYNFVPMPLPTSPPAPQKQALHHAKSNHGPMWVPSKHGTVVTGIKPSSIGSKSNSGGAATPPAPASGSSTASVNEAQGESKGQNQETFDDDIDMEHPDEIEDDTEADEQTFCSSRPSDGQKNAEQQHLDNVPIISTNTTQDQSQDTKEMQLDDETSPTDQPSMLSIKAKGKQAVRSPPNGHLRQESDKTDSVATYLRQAHGLSLDSLAIYLLPVKASVLLRHIDMHSLKALCLLNVGPQRALWATLTKLHRQSPLQLCSVYSDDVTQSLLTFLSNLPLGQLEELALLENGPRAKVPQLEGSGKSQVDADDIFNMVLKKHMKGLRRLVMRNDADEGWTIDPATVRLVARDGQQLRELGVQCYSNVFHALVRNLPLLKKLYALQVVFIVDVPQPSMAMNSNHSQPMGANYPASLTPLITNTILEELRHNIIDIMSQCGTADFELEYIGLAAVNGNAPSNVGLGPPAVVLSRVGRVWETWSDEDDDEDAAEKSEGAGDGRATNGEGGSRSRSGEIGGTRNGPLKKGAPRQLVVWTEDNMRMAELHGQVKMWSKELWAGRL